MYFPAPASFTGEHVLELQGHGGTLVLDLLLQRLLDLGCRMARPGEFSERAFLNGKIDIAQAEAIADLIDAGSRAAARAAVRSMQGEFSARINELQAQITELRTLASKRPSISRTRNWISSPAASWEAAWRDFRGFRRHHRGGAPRRAAARGLERGHRRQAQCRKIQLAE